MRRWDVCRLKKQPVLSLGIVEPQVVCSAQVEEEWEELDMLVDSGASVTVISDSMVKAVTACTAKPAVSYPIADE